jgi:hypothetical protein
MNKYIVTFYFIGADVHGTNTITHEIEHECEELGELLERCCKGLGKTRLLQISNNRMINMDNVLYIEFERG